MAKANSKPKDLESYFPEDASPLAMDLLRRMVRTRGSRTLSVYVQMGGVSSMFEE